MRPSRYWLFSGLFCTTFATLLLEILDARLLSVLTWYHLSFLAVSVAMLGMAAGAVRVFLAGPALDGAEALRRLPGFALAFALTMAVTHVVMLAIPLSVHAITTPIGLAAFSTTIALMAVPFYLSGVTVTIVLTRTGADDPRPGGLQARKPLSIGSLYAWDLVGAAFGCLAVVPLLDSGRFNLSSLILIGAGVAACGAWCFSVWAASTAPGAGRSRQHRVAVVAALMLFAAAGANGARKNGIEVAYPKNRLFWMSDSIDQTRWNSHSYVVLERARESQPYLWGGGAGYQKTPVMAAWMVIDGEAGTPITGWNGDRAALDWVRHDVTTLPYFLRRGSAAVIGVGGGRDILAALWGGNTRITGIDVNDTMLRFLTGSHRGFAGIADRPEVQLVHDDGRAYLTRTGDRFDVIQMSLIDTWAATGAGAFSLSENGLYTIEAWRVVLSRLTPTGIFSVSRWFSPAHVSETSRLLALATAALIDRGIADPLAHMLLVSRGAVATLVTSPTPFTDADREVLERVAAAEQFRIQVAPWRGGADPRLDRIARSRTRDELDQAAADPDLDFSPPTDNRPFFFNMLKPASFLRAGSLPSGGAVGGNIYATTTLVTLFFIATGMVAAVIAWPLVASGRPAMPGAAFAASLVYFGGIGIGFMLIQIALLQRFAIYLGHPTYTLSITLFAMILFAGAGSFLSERIPAIGPGRERRLAFATAALLLVVAAIVQPVTVSTIGLGLTARSAIAVALLAPVAMLLGCFFPAGLRLVREISPAAAAWMWGVNGACGVLGSIVAVGVSIWIGIHANLLAAALLYAGLAVPLSMLQHAADRLALRPASRDVSTRSPALRCR